MKAVLVISVSMFSFNCRISCLFFLFVLHSNMWRVSCLLNMNWYLEQIEVLWKLMLEYSLFSISRIWSQNLLLLFLQVAFQFFLLLLIFNVFTCELWVGTCCFTLYLDFNFIFTLLVHTFKTLTHFNTLF